MNVIDECLTDLSGDVSNLSKVLSYQLCHISVQDAYQKYMLTVAVGVQKGLIPKGVDVDSREVYFGCLALP